MQIREIDSGKIGPTVLVLAGVHGDEYEPMLTVKKLFDELKGHIVAGKLWVVDVVNTTAYQSAQRLGIDGLDLARSCPGNNEGSTTLQQAAAVSLRIRDCDYLIDLHTGGQLFDIFPLVGYMLHPDSQILQEQRDMAAAFGLPLVWGTDPLPDGRTLSIARDAHVPAIYVEYGGPGPVREKIIQSYYEGCVRVLHHLGMLLGHLSYAAAPRYFVEDAAPHSGHLQGKMLSPRAGIFTPKVKSGDCVTVGQVWGTVYDPIQHFEMQILADRNGLVLFVRCVPKVGLGESLGGILTIETKNGK